jgi:sigma-E factor negative regulatory protein RseB
MRVRSRGVHARIAPPALSALLLLVAVVTALGARGARAQDDWLQRAATAARTLDYVGTVTNLTYQHGMRVENSRLVHFNDNGIEFEKITSLDGPAREVIRVNDQVRCYYYDAKLMRAEPRALHSVFPSLLPRQIKTLLQQYTMRKAETARVAGFETQAWVFEPKDGLRYGHKFWIEPNSGLLLKVVMLNESNEQVEQFAFTDIQIGGRLDRSAFKTQFPAPPADWQVVEKPVADVALQDTGWVVNDVPAGFTKVMEGWRTFHGRDKVAWLVFSDGLVSISVFVEPATPAPQAIGPSQQGSVNTYKRPLSENLVTVLGEAPAPTVRQVASSVSRRP